MQAIFNIFAVPFGYVMEFIYKFVGNYGLSIILFSLLAKIVLLPFSIKSKKGMMATQRLQPKMQAIQKKYGNDKQKYNEEIQKLYTEEGVSPMSGCGPTLLTFPIMIGLYYVIQKPLTYIMHLATSEIDAIASGLGVALGTSYTAQMGLAQTIYQRFTEAYAICDKVFQMDFTFLGLDLSATPSFKDFSWMWIIPILSGATAYFMSWASQRMLKHQMGGNQDSATNSTNKIMQFVMPLTSVYFAFILPAGLGLYWIANNLFSTLQDYLITLYLLKKQDGVPETAGKKKHF